MKSAGIYITLFAGLALAIPKERPLSPKCSDACAVFKSCSEAGGDCTDSLSEVKGTCPGANRKGLPIEENQNECDRARGLYVLCEQACHNCTQLGQQVKEKCSGSATAAGAETDTANAAEKVAADGKEANPQKNAAPANEGTTGIAGKDTTTNEAAEKQQGACDAALERYTQCSKSGAVPRQNCDNDHKNVQEACSEAYTCEVAKKFLAGCKASAAICTEQEEEVKLKCNAQA